MARSRAPRKLPSGIRTWEDDPLSFEGCKPVPSSVPKFPTSGLTITIQGAGLPEAKVYPPGGARFRYWVAYEGLNRGLTFWRTLLDRDATWQRTNGRDTALPVRIDLPSELNAYYDRTRLAFGFQADSNEEVHTCESPDILGHELGHAVLDSIKPNLFDALSDEIAAFHEAFSDIAAMLTTLQLKSFRVAVLEETEGHLQNTSRLSRLGEQYARALRRKRPDTVEADCLRNAANAFFYSDPIGLPPNAPASALSSSAHSFSRVFTGAFLELLAGMLRVESPNGNPTETELKKVTETAARLLLGAVRDAELVPRFYAEVARRMLDFDELSMGGRFRKQIQTAFTRKGILEVGVPLDRKPSSARKGAASEVQFKPLVLQGAMLGFAESEIVTQVPVMAGTRFASKGAAASENEERAREWDKACKSFVLNLFRRGRVDLDAVEQLAEHAVHPPSFLEGPRSHRVEQCGTSHGKPELRILRRFFDV